MTGDKRYELSNHLGNVLVVINDKKIPEFEKPDMPETGLVAFNADVLSYSDYYPFGMLQDARHGSKANYRYGFNGMEKDDELKGEGNSYDFGARMYDSRVGRWFSTDPIEKSFSSFSPYIYSFNNPILFTDPDGEKPVPRWYPIYILSKVSNFKETFKRAWKNSNHGNSSFWGIFFKSGPEEWAFTITYNPKTKKIYSRNLHTDSSGLGVDQNHNVPKGEIVIGDVHTHPYSSEDFKDEPGTKYIEKSEDYDGAGFSSKDINSLLKKYSSRDGFFKIVETEETRYAIMITDSEKAQKYFKDNDVEYLYDKGFDSEQEIGFEKRVERAGLNAIGKSSDSGIMMLKTTNKNKTEWKELN